MMKRTNWRFILVLSAMLTAFYLSVAAKPKKAVQRGMTKQEVIGIMGHPKATSFNDDGELWEYHKTELLGDEHRIFVNFDRSNRVNAYQDIFIPLRSNADQNTRSVVTPPYGNYPIGGMPYNGYPYNTYAMSEQDFGVLYGKVKRASFDDDKYALIEVATLGCYYTCGQCARLMDIFSFGDDKIRALRLMARHIVDPQNAYTIYQAFTFDSDRDKAARIIQDRCTPNGHLK